MIKSDAEYKRVSKELDEIKCEQQKQASELLNKGLTADDVNFALSFAFSRQTALEQDLSFYNSIKVSSDFHFPLDQIGKYLVALRVKSGISQKEFAKKLEVSESLVSRDEGNEYSGITLDRALRILDALGAPIHCSTSFGNVKSVSVPSNLIELKPHKNVGNGTFTSKGNTGT